MKNLSTIFLFLTLFFLAGAVASQAQINKDPINFTYYENGDKYEVSVSSDEIHSIIVNGKKVPEEEFNLYEDSVMNKYHKVKEELEGLDVELEGLEEKLADLDVEFEGLDEKMKNLKIDLDGLNIDVKIDGDEIKESIETALESLKDLDISININGEDFEMNLDEMKAELKELENLHVSINDNKIKLALEGLDEKLSKIDVNLDNLSNIKINIDDEMNNVTAQISGLNVHLDNLSDFIDELKSELVDDGLIESKEDSIRINFKDGNLFINGNKVPDELQKKYKKLHKKYKH